MDEDSIRRIKAGDIGGLEHLVVHYQERALQIATLVTGDPSQAQDVVQDAFIRAYEQAGHFDLALPFGPWFFKIVANLGVRAASRTRQVVSLDAEDEGLVLPDPDGDLERVSEKIETEADIRRALNALPPEQRAVFVLHYLGDLKEAEIARELNRPPGTIKWRLFRARERLQVLLSHLSSKARL
jgi:RNA polymerase sigma-70 factor, ECF subfamily